MPLPYNVVMPQYPTGRRNPRSTTPYVNPDPNRFMSGFQQRQRTMNNPMAPPLPRRQAMPQQRPIMSQTLGDAVNQAGSPWTPTPQPHSQFYGSSQPQTPQTWPGYQDSTMGTTNPALNQPTNGTNHVNYQYGGPNANNAPGGPGYELVNPNATGAYEVYARMNGQRMNSTGQILPGEEDADWFRDPMNWRTQQGTDGIWRSMDFNTTIDALNRAAGGGDSQDAMSGLTAAPYLQTLWDNYNRVAPRIQSYTGRDPDVLAAQQYLQSNPLRFNQDRLNTLSNYYRSVPRFNQPPR